MPRRTTPFRPRFTLTLLYLAGFYLLYALLFALPDLVAGYQALGPGPETLTSEELARAEEITRGALSPVKELIALGAALLTVVVGARTRLLPGMR
jgi:hypothetical protein